MPEGHTIHRSADELNARFAGKVIQASSPQSRFDAGADAITGARLKQAQAVGKHLLVTLTRQRKLTTLHVHLGLYGAWSYLDLKVLGEVPSPVGQVRLRIQTHAAVADLRGPTACELLDPEQVQALLHRLGPDPIAAGSDESKAWNVISTRNSPISVLLMRQDVIAGVGNVYRAEVLFRFGINPMTPGRLIGRDVWLAMWADLVMLMNQGVRSGQIDTVASEHLPEAMGRSPRIDRHGGEVYVYRRENMPCLVCSTPIAKAGLASRNVFWCPTCQR